MHINILLGNSMKRNHFFFFIFNIIQQGGSDKKMSQNVGSSNFMLGSVLECTFIGRVIFFGA